MDYDKLRLKQIRRDNSRNSQDRSIYITVWPGGEPRLRNGELRAERRATMADLEYVARAYTHFQHRLLKALYGRHWAKRTDISFEWTGNTEAKTKDGRPCAPHVHARLSACILNGLTIEEVERRALKAWRQTSKAFFLRENCGFDLQWIASHEEAGRAESYNAKHVHDPFTPVRVMTKQGRANLAAKIAA